MGREAAQDHLSDVGADRVDAVGREPEHRPKSSGSGSGHQKLAKFGSFQTSMTPATGAAGSISGQPSSTRTQSIPVTVPEASIRHPSRPPGSVAAPYCPIRMAPP